MSATSETELSLYDRTKPNYRKHYVPLESDPEIFTDLIKNLGVQGYEFQDVLSLEDPDLLAFIPRPVLAFVFVFPTLDEIENRLKDADAHRKVYEGKGEEEPVIWFSQSIQNACGLYAILHAVSNAIPRSSIQSGSPLDNLLKTCIPLGPYERALALEASSEIEAAHAAAAKRGSSEAPAAEDDVDDFHYICFARSPKNNHIYELNGTVKGPIDTGVVQESEDLLSAAGIELVKNYIKQGDGNLGFSLMALVATN
ncbi:ubiquitin C-terminal hydrolase L3 [Coprinopsis cinerea okayama7|uniref:Ubiquitin carboxyl-terminal hydrolase n=1 Tax=Coprinopsis cinerea (strain Okayama-7 / 130 / ATCC MYA-4618 / FGSC 9003) TaxID=240176 RepID=A8N689_COPC7|nr:ubiquitin C-terminal hydrolase L3 [Coprinopsis cinerea okayama7\|eukprot:XP_001830362.1 ubiquitin C-terminal hydrolase L3 [Coprinopsis cinerea okayama7\